MSGGHRIGSLYSEHVDELTAVVEAARRVVATPLSTVSMVALEDALYALDEIQAIDTRGEP